MQTIKKHALTLLAFFLAFLLLISTLIFIRLYVRELHANKRWMPFNDNFDSKCYAFQVQNANLAEGQIVFLGDSITDSYVLDDYYGDLPLATYNRGISGDTVTGLQRRLVTSALEIKPKKIVLLIGTNDVSARHENAEILATYEDIVKTIRRELPNTELYCLSLLPRYAGNRDEEETIAEFTRCFLAINDEIRRFTALYDATFVDTFALFADGQDRMPKKYSDDGLHLNDAGYALLSDHLRPYLAQ